MEYNGLFVETFALVQTAFRSQLPVGTLIPEKQYNIELTPEDDDYITLKRA